jgi:hypothetical protein
VQFVQTAAAEDRDKHCIRNAQACVRLSSAFNFYISKLNSDTKWYALPSFGVKEDESLSENCAGDGKSNTAKGRPGSGA